MGSVHLRLTDAKLARWDKLIVAPNVRAHSEINASWVSVEKLQSRSGEGKFGVGAARRVSSGRMYRLPGSDEGKAGGQ
jgi:hypothetical protein